MDSERLQEAISSIEKIINLTDAHPVDADRRDRINGLARTAHQIIMQLLTDLSGTLNIDGVAWTPNPDGEYNEHCARVNQVEVIISSDRDGESWNVQFANGELLDLEAKTLPSACKEATKWALEDED